MQSSNKERKGDMNERNEEIKGLALYYRRVIREMRDG